MEPEALVFSDTFIQKPVTVQDEMCQLGFARYNKNKIIIYPELMKQLKRNIKLFCNLLKSTHNIIIYVHSAPFAFK